MRRSLPFLSLAAALLAGAAVGCEDVDSDSVLTSGLYADMSVDATGDGTSDVTVYLRVGGALSNTFLNLVGDDRLRALADSENKMLTHLQLLNMHWYETSFDTDAEDTEFLVAFERTVDQGAPNSVVTLPAPFEITEPVGGETFSRDVDDIVVGWAPAGSVDEMTLSITGSCIDSYYATIPSDTGTITIGAGEIEPSDPDAPIPESCAMSIAIERRREGDIDPHYGEGGFIDASQRRSVSVTSAP
jgi:hypothetical protein